MWSETINGVGADGKCLHTVITIFAAFKIYIEVLKASLLSLDLGAVTDDDIRDKRHKFVCFLAHVESFFAEWVVGIGIVGQAIGPDETKVVDEFLFGFVGETLEFFDHGANVHGLFDDVQVVGGVAFVYSLQEGGGIFGHCFELHEDFLGGFVELFLADLVLACPFASTLADFADEGAKLSVVCVDQVPFGVDPGDQVLEGEARSAEIGIAQGALDLTRSGARGGGWALSIGHFILNLAIQIVQLLLFEHGIAVGLEGVEEGVEAALGGLLGGAFVLFEFFAHILRGLGMIRG